MKEELNPEQQVAVMHMEGPLLVLAGAGSGKTRIVTCRIAHLLERGVPSQAILAVTFTNRAAEEMRHRVLLLTHTAVLTCTFHSLCAKILRESIHFLGFSKDFFIYDEEESEKVLKECAVQLCLKEGKGELKSMRSEISRMKNALMRPESESIRDKALQDIYKLYQSKLKAYNALDFDDLLFKVVDLFCLFPEVLHTYQERWAFILIDEYQDTNMAQYALTKKLAEQHGNVFAVGDPDQSVYSWRGADVHNILNFERDFPGAKIVALEQNYRSCSNILEAANALISHNTGRYKKNLWSDRGQGDPIGLFIAENDRAEAQFVVNRMAQLCAEKRMSFNECVIFYRTNFQSRTFEDQLLKERIPYIIVGGISFYQRREIKDLLALLRMAISNSDFLALSRTINLPKRGWGEAALAKLRECALDIGSDLWTSCEKIADSSIVFKLSPKQSEGLKEYVAAIRLLRTMVQTAAPLHAIIEQAASQSRYLDYLKEDPETYEERRSNIEELVSKAAEWEQEVGYPSLVAFLEELSLKSSSDDPVTAIESVRLMTLHNGKGLEFKAVFLVGMEEDLFPHANARENDAALEEERRLCYVGMTRAKDHLYLTGSRYRYLWGMSRMMNPSRFLQEIPSSFLQTRYDALAFQESHPPSSLGEEKGFEVGEMVFHKDFGPGKIQKSYRSSLGLTYDVYFPQSRTTRSLVAKFAMLKKLENASFG